MHYKQSKHNFTPLLVSNRHHYFHHYYSWMTFIASALFAPIIRISVHCMPTRVILGFSRTVSLSKEWMKNYLKLLNIIDNFTIFENLWVLTAIRGRFTFLFAFFLVYYTRWSTIGCLETIVEEGFWQMVDHSCSVNVRNGISLSAYRFFYSL